MSWLFLGVAYPLVHFAVYSFVLRHTHRFGRERAIFLYHFLSAFALACLLIGALALWPATISLPAAAAVVSLHGIYSLSFLELWALAEGGFSLDILRHVKAMQDSSSEVPAADLMGIGASRKESRIQSLENLRLVRRRDDTFELAGLGSIVAAVLQGVSWTANLKSQS